jgi:hypothetical protein
LARLASVINPLFDFWKSKGCALTQESVLQIIVGILQQSPSPRKGPGS